MAVAIGVDLRVEDDSVGFFQIMLPTARDSIFACSAQNDVKESPLTCSPAKGEVSRSLPCDT